MVSGRVFVEPHSAAPGTSGLLSSADTYVPLVADARVLLAELAYSFAAANGWRWYYLGPLGSGRLA